jgi:hypothetical protein
MRKTLLFVITLAVITPLLSSCDWARNTSKKAVHKAGEIVGQTGSEFSDGVYRGVKKTFDNSIELSEKLQLSGIEVGEVTISSSSDATDNILMPYIIFNNDFEQLITVKLYNEKGKEYGRLTQNVSGKKGEAHHWEFVFDKHVSIGNKGTITVQ